MPPFQLTAGSQQGGDIAGACQRPRDRLRNAAITSTESINPAMSHRRSGFALELQVQDVQEAGRLRGEDSRWRCGQQRWMMLMKRLWRGSIYGGGGTVSQSVMPSPTSACFHRKFIG